MESASKTTSRLEDQRSSTKSLRSILQPSSRTERKRPGQKCQTESESMCGCHHPNKSLAVNPANNSIDNSSGRWHNNSLTEPPREKNSDEEMAHYLLNQILLIVGGLSRFNRQKITFLEFLEVLRELNMIPPSYEPSNSDQVYDMWAMLCQGNRDLSACLINYAILLLAVMNIRGQPAALKKFFESVPYADSTRMTLPNRKRSTHALVVEHPFHKNKQGFFELTKAEVHKIYKSFQQFRVTRMHLGQIERKVEIHQDKSTPRYPFQPLISDRSRAMHRSDSKKKCSEHYIDSREKENIECTFQPNSHRSASRKKGAGIRKSEELYRLSKEREKKLANELKQDDESCKKECTFHPKISAFAKRKTEPSKQQERSHAEEKQIQRLKKARLQKELNHAVQKTGTTLTEKVYTKLRNDLEKAFKQKSSTPATSERLRKALREDARSIQQPHKTSPEKFTSPTEECQVPQSKVLMTIEIFISEGQVHNLTVHEADDPEHLAKEFSRVHSNSLGYPQISIARCVPS